MGKPVEKKLTYDPTLVAFDIETTSFEWQGVKKSVVYSYAVAVEGDVVVMRTAEEFVRFIEHLCDDGEHMPISINHRLCIYVHNLGYEWQFIKHLFEWSNVFANGSERNVIRAVTTAGVEFRCSLALTNVPLKVMGDMVGVEKMVGDLDYSLPRHHLTPLTDEEMRYIVNDVRIIIELLRSKLAEGDDLASIPMTKTGYVRRIMRGATLKSGRNRDYVSMVQRLTMDPDFYQVARQAYQGGFTHANGQQAGKVHGNVVAYDLASSYPSSLAQFQFPMSAFTDAGTPGSLEEALQLVGESCAVLDVEFREFTTREQYHFPTISESKCLRSSDTIVDNGRVYAGESARIILTNIDLAMAMRCYEAKDIIIHRVWLAKADYLPKEFVMTMLGFYRDKTTLKTIGGYRYRLAKEAINGIYGMVATDPVRAEFELVHGTCDIITKHVNIEESLLQHNTSKKRFLFYPWGVWCTAYSRAILLTAIMDLEDAGTTVLYCDTDSIYMVDDDAAKGVIEQANESITCRMQAAMAAQGLSEDEALEYTAPEDAKGVRHPLGLFELDTEEPIEFKTLGAKRYAKRDSKKFGITVAGLSKAAAGYVAEHGGFEFFTDDMTIPAGTSGRITHHYDEGIVDGVLVDYLGQAAEVFQEGYIHLEASAYHMGLSNEYKDFMLMMNINEDE